MSSLKDKILDFMSWFGFSTWAPGQRFDLSQMTRQHHMKKHKVPKSHPNPSSTRQLINSKSLTYLLVGALSWKLEALSWALARHTFELLLHPGVLISDAVSGNHGILHQFVG